MTERDLSESPNKPDHQPGWAGLEGTEDVPAMNTRASVKKMKLFFNWFRANWEWCFEVLKFPAVIGAILIGVHELDLHVEQQHRANIIGAAQVAQQSAGVKKLHEDIQDLITLFKNSCSTDINTDLSNIYSQPTAYIDLRNNIVNCIEDKIMQDGKFIEVISSFKTLNLVGKEIPDAFDFISGMFYRDNADFNWYFCLEYYPLAQRRKDDLDYMYDIELQRYDHSGACSNLSREH
jgi:hypothetical protein